MPAADVLYSGLTFLVKQYIHLKLHFITIPRGVISSSTKATIHTTFNFYTNVGSIILYVQAHDTKHAIYLNINAYPLP